MTPCFGPFVIGWLGNYQSLDIQIFENSDSLIYMGPSDTKKELLRDLAQSLKFNPRCTAVLKLQSLITKFEFLTQTLERLEKDKKPSP